MRCEPSMLKHSYHIQIIFVRAGNFEFNEVWYPIISFSILHAHLHQIHLRALPWHQVTLYLIKNWLKHSAQINNLLNLFNQMFADLILNLSSPVWNPCIGCARCAPQGFQCCANFSHKKTDLRQKYICFLFVWRCQCASLASFLHLLRQRNWLVAPD